MHDFDDGQSIAVGWPCGRATFGTTSWGRDVSAFAADAGTASALHIITDAIHALMNLGIRPPPGDSPEEIDARSVPYGAVIDSAQASFGHGSTPRVRSRGLRVHGAMAGSLWSRDARFASLEIAA
jgi:hypothetical protein